MEKESSEFNSQYNDEVFFLDNVAEFHPEILEALPADDQEVIKKYYLTDMPVPENIFVYRSQILREEPELENKARQVFARILTALGIEDFTYSEH